MKKITVYDMFLIFAIILYLGREGNIWTAVILLCAGILEAVDVVPKIAGLFKDDSK